MSAILRLVHSNTNLDHHPALAVLAGWKSPHHAMESEMAELRAIADRDNEARTAAARRAAR